MSSFASVFDEDSPLAHGTDPGEVTEEGVQVFFKETDALSPRESSIEAAFGALHGCLRLNAVWKRRGPRRSTVRGLSWIVSDVRFGCF